MNERIVFNYKGLEVKVSGEADEEITGLLSSTVVGSEGGMQYTIHDIPGKVKAYGDCMHFVTLRRNYSLAAVIGACYRVVNLGEIKYPSTFLRFLSFRHSYQTEKSTARSHEKSDERYRGGSFRYQALKIFSKPHLLGFPGVGENDRHILYALVESKNERTKNIIQQAGFEYIRSFLTVAFSRFRPAGSPSVSVAGREDYPVIVKHLKDFYRNYSFYFDDTGFSEKRFYVLKENGQIIAGVSAIPTEYVIRNVPGVWGWIMMKVLPFAPWYRRLFDPDLFRFAALSSIFHLPGREDVLASLFESVCVATGCNTALTWVDDRGPLYETLRNRVDMGALNRMLNARPGLVYANFIGYSEEDKEPFYDAPTYISGFDFS